MRFPVSSAELNRRETVGSTPEVKLQAAKAFANPPPAISRQAHRPLKDIEYLIDHAIDQAELQAEIIQEALADAYDSQVWKSDYKSIVEWVEAKWGKSKSWTYQMLQSHIRDLDQKHGIVITPESTSSGLGCDDKPPTPKRAKSKKPSFSAENTEEPEKPQVQAGAQNEPVETTEPPRDASGCVIPQALLDLRERRQEVTEAEHHASKLGALLEKVQNDGSDLLWRHLKATGSLQTWLHAVQTVRFNLAECLPDVVCPQCNGKGCQYCCGSGWISEVRWNRDYVKSHDSQKLAIVAKRNGHHAVAAILSDGKA